MLLDKGHQVECQFTLVIYPFSVQFYKAIKGSGHYWLLLKIIIGIKPYLVKSNGELLIV